MGYSPWGLKEFDMIEDTCSLGPNPNPASYSVCELRQDLALLSLSLPPHKIKLVTALIPYDCYKAQMR